MLTAFPADPDTNFGQLVISAKNLKSREVIKNKVETLLTTEFPAVLGNIKYVRTGPSDPYPVMLRVSGYDHDKVRLIAAQVRDRMVADPQLVKVNMDWTEKTKVVRLKVDQDKARMLGLSNQVLSSNLQAFLSGATVGEFRERDKTVSIDFRLDSAWRDDLSRLKDLNIYLGGGKYIPLEQVATISSGMEDGLIWRRNLKPTITVQADTVPGVMGDTATQGILCQPGRFTRYVACRIQHRDRRNNGNEHESDRVAAWAGAGHAGDHCQLTDVPAAEYRKKWA